MPAQGQSHAAGPGTKQLTMDDPKFISETLQLTVGEQQYPTHTIHTTAQTVKGVVVLIHGMGEHAGRYLDSVVPVLRQNGLAVVLYDQPGHGHSAGKRGVVSSYEVLLDLLGEVVLRATSLFPGIPVILYGHSMGGNIALNFVLRRNPEISGLILSSPYLRLAFSPPAWKMGLGRMLLKLSPSVTMPSGLDPEGISSEEREVQRYKEDPLIHNRINPVYAFSVMDAGEWALANAEKLQIPTLILHGMDDPIIDPDGSRQLHKAASITLKLYPGLKHELHHDRLRSELFGDIADWLGQILPKGAVTQA